MTYQELKDLVAKKNLAWQYFETASKYELFALDGVQKYEAVILKSLENVVGADPVQEAANKADFEANYKSKANFAIGQRPYAFATGDFQFYGDGNFSECPAGGTVQVEYVFAENLYVNGGELYVLGSALGDWIKIEVVHPQAGVVATYVAKRYVPMAPAAGPSGYMKLATPYAAYISAGLKLRLTYNSTAAGGAAPKFAVNYDLHRAI